MYLQGFTTVQDQATYLTQSLTSSATTLTVADTTAVSRGLIEIEDELLWVDSVDSVSLNLLVPPYGRGYRSTTAAAHASGVRVVTSPMFPRSLVKAAINEAVSAVFPDVFAVGSTTFTFNGSVSTYALPAGAQDVLQVSTQTIGPSLEWTPVRRWRVDGSAATSAFATGATVSVYDAIMPGRSVKVVYTKQPTAMVNGTDDFAATTGLSDSCAELVRMGAAYRMIPFFDAPHLAGYSAEADFSANMRPVGSGASLGRYLLQMYQLRLAQEANRLRNAYPIRSHYTL
jgi:hypothetical protein